eukprot:s1214_g11.t1
MAIPLLCILLFLVIDYSSDHDYPELMQSLKRAGGADDEGDGQGAEGFDPASSYAVSHKVSASRNMLQESGVEG